MKRKPNVSEKLDDPLIKIISKVLVQYYFLGFHKWLAFLVWQKRSFYILYTKQTAYIYRYSITVSKLVCICTEGWVDYSQSFVKFVCLTLKTYTQLESAFHVVFVNVAFYTSLWRKMLTIRLGILYKFARTTKKSFIWDTFFI